MTQQPTLCHALGDGGLLRSVWDPQLLLRMPCSCYDVPCCAVLQGMGSLVSGCAVSRCAVLCCVMLQGMGSLVNGCVTLILICMAMLVLTVTNSSCCAVL
jgi:hypothetical protein